MKPLIYTYSHNIKLCEYDDLFFLSIKENEEWSLTATFSTLQELINAYQLDKERLRDFYIERFLFCINNI